MKKITSILFWVCCVFMALPTNAQLLSEDFEAGLGQFANESANTVDWQIDTNLFQDGAQSVHNAYASDSENILYQTDPIDLTTANNPQLTFWHIAKTEGSYDDAIVEISTDGGATFSPFTDADYLGNGVTASAGTFDEDSYSQWGTSSTDTPSNAWWKQEFFDLSAYNTATVVVRFRLTSDISGERAGWYLDNVRILEINCPYPTELTTSNATDTSIEIGWTSAGSETEWEVVYGEPGFDPETEGTSVQDNDGTLGVEITGLTAETNYDFYVKAICGSADESLFAGPGSFYTGYCEFEGTDSTRYIDGFTTSQGETNINNTGSGYSPNGYNDATDMVVSQYAGGTIEFTIDPAGSGTHGVNIWVDWNNNFEFEDSEKAFDSDGYIANPSSGSFDVPAEVANGDYRMRVVALYIGSDPEPCGTTSYGEAEDYTFTVVDPPACMKPVDLVVDNITATGVDVSWTASNTETEWEIKYGPSGFDPETEGTALQDIDGTIGETITGLNPATEYDFYVKAICGPTDESVYAGPSSFITLCAVVTPYYAQNFDNFLPSCWEEAGAGLPSAGPSGFGSSSWSEEEFLNTGSNMAAHINLYASTKEEWLISLPIDLSGDSYELVYTAAITDYNNSDVPEDNGMGSDDEVQVLISTDDGATWDNLKTYNQADFPSATGDVEIIDLSAYSGTAKIAFWASEGTVNDSEDYDFFIDDFIVRVPPTCPQPTDLMVSNITTTSADLEWTEGGSASTWDIELGTEGFTPTGTPTETGVTNPYSATGLSPATSYEFYVRADCGPGDLSMWSGPYMFSTECAAVALPWSEDFASDSTPNCWEEGGDNAWDYSTNADYAASEVLDHTPGGGTNYAWIDGTDNGDGETSTLTSVPVDVSTLTVPALEFYLFSNNTNDDAVNIVDVEIYNGTEWNDILNISNLQGANWKQFVVDLSPYNVTGPVQIRFSVTGNDNSGSAYYNDILLDDVTFIEMPDCVDPIATFEVVEDCINGPQFFVEVDVTNIGGDTPLEITDNQGSAAQTASAPDTFTFGPFTNGTPVEITIENTNDANCSLVSGELTQETCVNNYVDCNVGPVNTNFCYENGVTTEYIYTSSDGAPLNLVVNAGNVEDGWDEFIVLDSDGTELYNGYGNNGDLSGLNFQSTGDTITIQVTADSINGCTDSSYDPIDVNVSCATCVNPSALYSVQSDCDSGTDQFFIDVEITDLGSANSLSIEDNQGNPVQTANATDVYTFGPYPNTTDVVFTIENDDDANCVITSGSLTQEFCPADNTNCDEAEMAIVNDGNLCEDTTSGTLQGATASNVPVSCGGTVAQDVWYEFTATSTEHMTALLEADGSSSSDLYHAIYEGDSCGNLTELFCSEEFDNGGNSPNIVAENLTIGQTYKVRVFSTSVEDEQFNLCITTPDFGENTTCGDVAPFCAPTDASGDPEPLIFPNGYFYQTESVAESGPDYDCVSTQPNPAWYYLQVDDTGDLEFEIIQSTAFDENGQQIGDGLDVDFVAYGPFDSVDDNCNQLTAANVVDCSYLADTVETMTINGAQEGDVYIVLITNYTQSPGYISLGQTNFGESGGGTTDCTILDTTLYACGDEVITLTSQFPEALAYVWYELNPATEQYDIIEGEETSTLEVSEAGTYKLVSYDSSGVPSEEVFTVEYAPEPEIDLGEVVSLCDVNQVTLDATPINAADFGTPIEYTWYQDGTEIAGETSATINVTENGTYSVEVIGAIVDEDGNPVGSTCTGTDSVEVSTSNFTLDLGGDQSFCDQESYTIDATLTGEDPADATFEWSDSNGVIAGETGQSITVTEADTYTVEVTLDGCVGSESVTIYFYESPQVDLGGDITTCDLGGLTLDATPSNFAPGEVNYQWSFDGSPIAETGAVVNVADYGYGSYSVTLTDTNTDSACGPTTETVTITERGDIGVSLSTNVEEQNLELYYCDDVENPEIPEQSYTFTANLSNATADEVEFVWYKNGDEIIGAQEQSYTVSYDSDGDYADTYEVDVYVGSCAATASIDVSVVIGPYPNGCTISEGLSPDTTPGINDCLDLSFLSQRSGIKSLKVYNRYGRLVFEQNNYVDSFCGQDDDGDKLINGTYYYILEFENEDPVFGLAKKDWIYINRESN